MKKIFNAFLLTSLLSSSLCLAHKDWDSVINDMEYTADAHSVFSLKRKFETAQSKPYPVKKYQLHKLSQERKNLSIALRNRKSEGTRANYPLLRAELESLKK